MMQDMIKMAKVFIETQDNRKCSHCGKTRAYKKVPWDDYTK